MADSLRLVNIGDFYPKVCFAIYALFLFYGISHSVILENGTNSLNAMENPLMPKMDVNWITQNSTQVQNITSEEIITTNQSQRTSSSSENLSGNSEFSVGMDYTESTDALSKSTGTSTDFERIETFSVAIETDIDQRYGAISLIY